MCAVALSYLSTDAVVNLNRAHARHECLWVEIGLPKAVDFGEADGGWCVHP